MIELNLQICANSSIIAADRRPERQSTDSESARKAKGNQRDDRRGKTDTDNGNMVHAFTILLNEELYGQR